MTTLYFYRLCDYTDIVINEEESQSFGKRI